MKYVYAISRFQGFTAAQASAVLPQPIFRTFPIE